MTDKIFPVTSLPSETEVEVLQPFLCGRQGRTLRNDKKERETQEKAINFCTDVWKGIKVRGARKKAIPASFITKILVQHQVSLGPDRLYCRHVTVSE